MRHSRIIDDERYNDNDFRPAKTVLHVTETIGRPEPVEKPAAPASAPRRLFSAAKKHFFPGAKKVTASTFAEQIIALRAEIGREEERRTAAAAILADPSFVTDEAHAKAQADIASADRAKVRLKGQIAHLEADQALQQKVEAEEAFTRRADQLRKQGAEVERRFKAEYEPAARAVADLMDALASFNDEKTRLAQETKILGQKLDIANPLAFRNATSKESFRASWPGEKPKVHDTQSRFTKLDFANGEFASSDDEPRGCGFVRSGPAEDAPEWAIRWVAGQPEAACEGVTIRSRGRTLAAHLPSSVRLPGLMWDDKPFVTPAA